MTSSLTINWIPKKTLENLTVRMKQMAILGYVKHTKRATKKWNETNTNESTRARRESVGGRRSVGM